MAIKHLHETARGAKRSQTPPAAFLPLFFLFPTRSRIHPGALELLLIDFIHRGTLLYCALCVCGPPFFSSPGVTFPPGISISPRGYQRWKKNNRSPPVFQFPPGGCDFKKIFLSTPGGKTPMVTVLSRLRAHIGAWERLLCFGSPCAFCLTMHHLNLSRDIWLPLSCWR